MPNAPFRLQTILENLDRLTLAQTAALDANDLEWILADFMLTQGQRLQLEPASWPEPGSRAGEQAFGYIYLPFSAAPDFPNVTPDQAKQLAMAIACSTLYIILLDVVVDEPEQASNALKLALQPILLRHHRLLSSLFPPESGFWDDLQRYVVLTMQSMLDELEVYGGTVHEFSLAEFARIAYDKMSLGRLSYIGLAHLNGTPERVPALTSCWNAIAFATTTRDDALDWRIDYANANYTYLLSQVLFSPEFREDVQAGNLPPVEEVGAALFASQRIEALYTQAADHLAAASGKAESIGCPVLAAMLENFQVRVRRHHTNLTNRKLAALVGFGGDDD